jgi:hypothetical protein
VGARRVELKAGKGKIVEATCIVAREYGAQASTKPIEWRLLTNRVATTVVEVAELIDWYRARWEIEMLFNVFKTGCKVEELQLGTIERIERALALYLVVAWRIAYLVRMGRTCPDLDASLFFDPDEIHGAYLLNKLRPPPTPTLNEVVRMIARVGGFLGPKRGWRARRQDSLGRTARRPSFGIHTQSTTRNGGTDELCITRCVKGGRVPPTRFVSSAHSVNARITRVAPGKSS